MTTRTSQDELRSEACAGLEAALLAVVGGTASRPPAGAAPDGVDVRLIVNGRPLAIEVKAMANADPGRVARHAGQWQRDLQRLRAAVGAGADAAVVVVADQVPEATKQLLRDAGLGWFDRRGHLRVRTPTLFVNDTEAPASPRARAGTSQPPIRGRGAITVALVLLQHPDDPPGVRAIAETGKLAVSTVSEVLTEFHDRSLVRGDRRPFTRDLFWAVVDAWAPTWTALAQAPDPGSPRLETGVDDPASPGWALAGSVAAEAWGAPMVLQGDHPPALYVPANSDLRAALGTLGEAATWDQRRASIAVAPAPIVVTHRLVPPTRVRGWEPWPVVHPVVAALDLARDRARGPEILDGWTPPAPYHRVW